MYPALLIFALSPLFVDGVVVSVVSVIVNVDFSVIVVGGSVVVVVGSVVVLGPQMMLQHFRPNCSCCYTYP